NQGIQNVGNQNGLSVFLRIANQHGNGNVVAARAEGNSNGINRNPIRCYNCQREGHYASNYTVKKRDATYLQTQLQIAQKKEAGIQLNSEKFDFMAVAGAYDEIEEVNVNCTLKDNLQQALTSGTQTDNAPVYDSDGSTEVHHSENCYDNDILNMFTQEEQYTELLEPILEPHQVQQNDSNVVSEVSSVERGEGTVEQYPATVEETRAYFESLYNNLAIEVEKVNTIAQKKEAGIQLNSEKFVFMAVAGAYDEIEEVNVNCTLKDNLQQALTSGTQTDNAPVYDSDGSTEVHHSENCYDNDILNMFTQEEQYTELLEPILEPHQVQQNDSNVISEVSSVERGEGTVEQYLAAVEETRAYFESLYNNLAIEVEKVNTYVNDMKSRKKNQSANVSKSANQKKHKANVKKLNTLSSKDKLASSRPSKPRTCLKWLPTGRIFDLCGKITSSSNTESESDTYVCDNASAFNP
nr:hypothetical protein [Tanacetum cinerariifolium]